MYMNLSTPTDESGFNKKKNQKIKACLSSTTNIQKFWTTDRHQSIYMDISYKLIFTNRKRILDRLTLIWSPEKGKS